MSTDSEHVSDFGEALDTSIYDSESDEEFAEADIHQPDEQEPDNHIAAPMRGAGQDRFHGNVVLRDFMRLITGPRFNAPEAATDNAELVNILKEINVVRSFRVERAMLTCPRGLFIPDEHANDAYLDSPIRVEDMEFNISAPHMHATCLEALEIVPGDKFLDVGSGCGIVAACGAFLVRSSLVGLPPRDVCRDYFDKIHVGGSCPEDKLHNLISLLKLDGGKMTVPVGSELRLITRRADGRASQRVLTQVRFSDLQVPTDADIILSTMRMEREEKMSVQIPPSTLKRDTKLVHSLSEPNPGIPRDAADRNEMSTSPKKLRRSISDFLGFRSAYDIARKEHTTDDVTLDMVHLTAPNCALVGDGWRLITHKAVLKVRCEYFRARFESEMKDSEDTELDVPSQFSKEVMTYFLQYIYKDDLPTDLEAQVVISILHVACYYGVPRLAVLCESLLAEELKTRHTKDPEGAAEFSAVLLTLADSNGLLALQTVVLQYIAEHFDLVSQTKEYRELSKREVDMIMKESFSQQQSMKKLLSDLSAGDKI